MKKLTITIMSLLLLVSFTINSFSITDSTNIKILSNDLTQQILDYRMNTVEKSKVRVFVMQHYKKYKNDSATLYAFNSAIQLCKISDYQLGKYNPYDVLRGKANCQGFSFMFWLMMNKANIPCRIVYSETHMWNELYLNSKWVKYDVTAMNGII
jgi:transglutaminase/protease-like cytokinesis protein 3